MAQNKALDALAPFIALSKSVSTPRQAANLVERATSHPNTYVFAELLQAPQIRALRKSGDPEYAAYLTLLQIFSYGTYADYERGTAPARAASLDNPEAPQVEQSQESQQPRQSQASQQSQEPQQSQESPESRPQQPQQTRPPPAPAPTHKLPALNDTQATKLRQLSLVTLAVDRAHLGYDTLMAALRLDDARALEALVIGAVYAGLVTATLDPAHAVVRISAVAPLRDLAPGARPRLHAALCAWSRRCEDVLADLDAQVAAIRTAAVTRTTNAARLDEQFRHAVENERRYTINRDDRSGAVAGGGGGTLAAGALSAMSALSSAASLGKRAMTLNMTGTGSGGNSTGGVLGRFKRGSKQMAASADAARRGNNDGGNDSMDVDDDAGDGNKRSRGNA